MSSQKDKGHTAVRDSKNLIEDIWKKQEKKMKGEDQHV
jgi:hypothetical protein